MDINKIQSALQSLKEERTHIEEYIQNAAAKKKEQDKELNAIFSKYNKTEITSFRWPPLF